MPERLRILLVTRSYPSPGNLYQYPFVHRRVLAYLAAGHEVAVFRPTHGAGEQFLFEGVRWQSGSSKDLERLASEWQPDCVAVHGLSETLWPALEPLQERWPICAWLHGSEIPEFARQKAEAIAAPDRRVQALRQIEARVRFWNRLLERQLPNLHLVFVSRASVEMMRLDMGARLRDHAWSIIHNPIDTDLFRYEPKRAEQRYSVLSIRPYDSKTYGNDLAVAAVLHLAQRPGFERFHFRFIGDGPLFDETLQPLRHLGAVAIERRFLTQEEIARQHRAYGIFLVPTRLDTQGVSRDEAMASGLVPVTNAIDAVVEFADQDCAALVARDDAIGMADAIEAMADQPDLFLQRSRHAAARVRRQSATSMVVPQEITLLRQAAAWPDRHAPLSIQG